MESKNNIPSPPKPRKNITEFYTLCQSIHNRFTYFEEQLNEMKNDVKSIQRNNNAVKKIDDYKKKLRQYSQLIKEGDNVNENVTCILCYDQLRNVLFRPCNHILICDKCSGSTDIQNCIACRGKIESFEYAYLV
jgi:hypothetical protein